VTAAYVEQYHDIGWYNFIFGRVSKKWANTIIEYNKATQTNRPNINPEYWASLLIAHLWKFIKNMWAHRNQIVHGTTGEEVAARIMSTLHASVRQHYQQY
jgi:hypothetical protein